MLTFRLNGLPLLAEVWAAYSAAILIAFCVIFVIFFLPTLVGYTLMFKKAGKPGIAAWIPIWNLWVMYDIAYGKGYMMFLLLIPIINGPIGTFLIRDFARSFGRGVFGSACFAIFMPITALIFGCSKKIEYVGPNGISEYQDYDYDNDVE